VADEQKHVSVLENVFIQKVLLYGSGQLWSNLHTVQFGPVSYGSAMKHFLIIIYFCLIFAFQVRMLIFLVHLWLPRAHVEALVSGACLNKFCLIVC
jgi:NADH-ubiquinone oxidoreductase chain 4